MNRYLPHVLVLPEDDANRQLANGFSLDLELDTRRLQVLPEAGGWQHVLDRFQQDHVGDMDSFRCCHMVLLIDFDGHPERVELVKAEIPERLRERVFVLGAWGEPEQLRRELADTYEQIGLALAKDCRDDTALLWAHRLLCHNAGELARLRAHVRPILFHH